MFLPVDRSTNTDAAAPVGMVLLIITDIIRGCNRAFRINIEQRLHSFFKEDIKLINDSYRVNRAESCKIARGSLQGA